MAFGAPCKYVQLYPEKSQSLRDQLAQSIRNGGKTSLADVWVRARRGAAAGLQAAAV